MISLFLHELRLNRRVMLALGGALGLFAFLMALIAPSIQESLNEAMKLIPSFLRPLVGDRLKATGLEGVLAIVYTHPVWLTLNGAWAVGYGARAIAADIERGTLGLTLAYPLSRTQVLASKALTLLSGIIAFALVTVLATAAGLAYHREALPAGPTGYAWAAIGMILLFGCIGAVSLACSAITGVRGSGGAEAGKALGWALGFAVVSYFIDALGQFWKTAEPYRVWSIFRHYDPKVLLAGTPPDLAAWAYLGGLALMGVIVAWQVFDRRDLSI